MCHQNSHPCVNAEEAVAADDSLLIYCKPLELYNILHRRARDNPPFLSRCLNYKIEARRKTGSRDQNVIFNYRDQNNLLQKTEVTRLFSCPFCLAKCGSFKGLRDHLRASHELFKFDFWSSEEYRAVNVSVRTDALCFETVADGTQPLLRSYCHFSKFRKRKRTENPLDEGKELLSHVFDPSEPVLIEDERGPGELYNSRFLRETCCSHENGISHGTDCAAAISNQGVPVARAQSVEDIDRSVPPATLPNAKSRKLSIERTDSRSSTLLQKRLFYHSHRAQPMALEQVLSDRDSEDEVDDGIADLEDRRVRLMLDDFVDVTIDEKQLMHMWNSFVRKQRVLADGHVPWACEAFVRLHGKIIGHSSPLFWRWRLFMIKLWNHGLLDGCTMNTCSTILQNYQDEASSVEKRSTL